MYNLGVLFGYFDYDNESNYINTRKTLFYTQKEDIILFIQTHVTGYEH